MENFLNYLYSEDGILMIFIFLIVVSVLLLINIMLTIYNNRKYIAFMKKIGNGNNVDEILREYLRDVKEIKQDNSEIKAYYTKLDSDIASCIQKIGLVRYNAFKDVDVMLAPVAPTPAYKLGSMANDPLKMYLMDIFTVPLNLAGLPGISIPCGRSKDNMPIGMQFIGRPLDEETIIRAAYTYEVNHDYANKIGQGVE